MVIEACMCKEGCGVAHSHTPARVRLKKGERIIQVNARDAELNPDWEVIEKIPSYIVVWVDWRAVAKELMRAEVE